MAVHRAPSGPAWRVHLRPTRDSDLAQTSGWLPEALAAAAGRSRAPYPSLRLDQFEAALPTDATLLIVALGDDHPVGVLVLTTRTLAAQIELLAIAEPRRNLGFGAEAVYAAEALRPGRSFLAGVPRENGLAIYFWLRVGYRPHYPSVDPRDLPVRRIWMKRDPLDLPMR